MINLRCIKGVKPYAELRPELNVFVVTWVGDSLLSRLIRRHASSVRVNDRRRVFGEDTLESF